MTVLRPRRGKHENRRKYRCPRPGCRRAFPSRRSVSQHLRIGECREWIRTAGLDFNEDSLSSDGLTNRDEEEAELQFFRQSARSRLAPNRWPGPSKGRRDSLAEPCVADCWDEYHPQAGRTFGIGRNLFDQIKYGDMHSERRSRNRYYPFSTKEDWETASWLCRCDLSRAEVDEYLHQNSVRCSLCTIFVFAEQFKGRCSFRSAREMNSRIEILPNTPVWRSCVIPMQGGMTKDPIILLYRDAFECFSFLFGHPTFVEQMDYTPRRLWVDVNKESRIFDEAMTGDYAWELQARNPYLPRFIRMVLLITFFRRMLWEKGRQLVL